MHKILLAAVVLIVPLIQSSNANADTPRPATLKGTLVIMDWAAGSKSEQKVLALTDASEHPVALRIKGDNPFQINSELAQQVGKTITCSGILMGYTLINAQCTGN